ncbi:MAG: selenide, water dikinase SelD, partial [Chitinophagales bacterium]
HRNFDSYGHKISGLDDYKKTILCDPQTSGGLLVAVASGYEKAFENLASENGFALTAFGKLIPPETFVIIVE